ncbi:adenylosuccinate lyase [Aestuariibaculum suncheonense]|uniref:Adenylosuccinate lyase n=1 Tax=Aestuariibaculum suncheonense TaxID=1028745 RepID=A0A8J6QBM8_9FLAO|nr:adenylosuccinate lyase [Aestuariibaculum suncheonense]MBD0834695.1 adenylosuccinate lyase [Aestuariibaculum suncheonense]
MTSDEFYKELSYISASRQDRLAFARLVLNDMSLFPKLIAISFMTDDDSSSRAAWVLELVCQEYIYAIIPHLDFFTNNLNKVQLESAIRPMAKICTFIAEHYTSKHPNPIKKSLTSLPKEKMIEACFDWMINDHKVAAKVHAMETLFLLGKETPWIHPQLVDILQQDFHHQSAAFKSRAKHILNKMKKLKKL